MQAYSRAAIGLVTVMALIGCSPKRHVTATKVGPGTKASVEGAAQGGTSITISGAWALYPMVVKWTESFRTHRPDVRFDVSAGGAGKGVADALSGMVDIGMVSRSLHEDEIARGAWWVPVCIDAVFPTINEANPVIETVLKKGVRRETLAGIWLTGKVKTWGMVAGGTGGEAIHVFTRADACGAAETWAKFLDKNAKQEDLKGTGVYGDPDLANAVVKDRLAIGFNNLNYAFDVSTGRPVAGLRILPIDTNGNGKVDPQEDFYDSKDAVLKAIQDGRYPSPPARELNFVCRGAPSGVTAEFIKWVLTEGQKECVASGYVPLPAQKAGQALRKLG